MTTLVIRLAELYVLSFNIKNWKSDNKVLY